MPTQASSEFITNKQQGDWAEDLLFRAINENSKNIVAVKYGKGDDLVAGDEGLTRFCSLSSRIRYDWQAPRRFYYLRLKIITKSLARI